MTSGDSRRSSVPALKLNPSRPTLLPAGLDDLVDRMLHLQPVAVQHRVDHRHVEVDFLRPVLQRAHVLRQARAAEREARLQVIRREVQLVVLAEDVHHLVAVDADALAQVADLVGEDHLHRVPRVARVLHHLGDADAGAEERRLDVLVERLGRRRVGGVVVADQRQRRMAEVLERRSLAQELGVDRDAEALAVPSCPSAPRGRGSPGRASCPEARCCARRRRDSRACS